MLFCIEFLHKDIDFMNFETKIRVQMKDLLEPVLKKN